MNVEEVVKAKMPLMEKADKIFGKSDSPAKQVFIDLISANGGLEPAANLLGKQKEYDACSKKFMQLANSGKSQKAADLLGSFVEKITMQLCEKFAIVKDSDLV